MQPAARPGTSVCHHCSSLVGCGRSGQKPLHLVGAALPASPTSSTWLSCSTNSLPILCCPLPRERGKLWDPSSKERWGHDAFEALERGEQPTGDDFTEVRCNCLAWEAGLGCSRLGLFTNHSKWEHLCTRLHCGSSASQLMGPAKCCSSPLDRSTPQHRSHPCHLTHLTRSHSGACALAGGVGVAAAAAATATRPMKERRRSLSALRPLAVAAAVDGAAVAVGSSTAERRSLVRPSRRRAVPGKPPVPLQAVLFAPSRALLARPVKGCAPVLLDHPFCVLLSVFCAMPHPSPLCPSFAIMQRCPGVCGGRCRLPTPRL